MNKKTFITITILIFSIFITGCKTNEYYFIDTTPTFIKPTSFQIIAGTNTSGNLTSTQYVDNIPLNITELNGPNPLEIRFNFTTQEASQVNIKYFYTGTHDLHLEIYNYNTNTWMIIKELQNGITDFTNEAVPIFRKTPYNQNNTYQLRIYHPQLGVSTHLFRLDAITLVHNPYTDMEVI